VHAAPPLGIAETGPDAYTIGAISFAPGDTLLLYPADVIEARDAAGRCYPFETRAAHWNKAGPESLLHRIQHDPLTHTHGRPNGDAALVALHREPDSHRSHRRVIHSSGFGHAT
jgi:hypothetical protein